jgi:hypothetical protein
VRRVRSLAIVGLSGWLIVVLSFTAAAQKAGTESKPSATGAQRLNQGLAASVQLYVDNTLRGDNRFCDSIVSLSAQSAQISSTKLDALRESLLTSAKDSLDSPRRDTLLTVARSFQKLLLTSHDTTQRLVSSLLSSFTERVGKAKKVFSTCNDCEEPADVTDRFEQFKDVADSLREAFREQASELGDERRDLVDERFEAYHDSLIALRENLIENRLSLIDYQRYSATRLSASATYSSRSIYRGRDNGLPQQMISPAIAFYHSWGFNAEISTYWLDQTPKKWDDIAVTLGYEFTTGSVLGGNVSYSHFWFSDSSRSAKSVFKNSFGAGLSANLPVVSFSLDADLATGTASEFSLTAGATHEFEIPLSLYNSILFNPAVTAIIGEQNSSLTTLRTKGAKGKKIVGVQTQTSSTFGILDYEMSLPCTLLLGPLTLSPSVTYVVPMNVIDESTTTPFFVFGVSASITFR